MVKAYVDKSGLCKRVTLEARPKGGNLGLPYDPKDLEKFDMATQRLVLIHPHEAKILRKKDIVIGQEKVTTEDTAMDIRQGKNSP